MSYTKQNWATGDKITADKLNHIEDGVYNAFPSDQGTANAGKFAVVGSDGKMTVVSMQTWQGGNY